MERDIFLQRKKEVLSKIDKSNKKGWDKPILNLCNKINSNKDYYTTSSCSGRILIMVDQEKKAPELFKFNFHNLIENVDDFIKIIEQIKGKDSLKFKLEPCILHVACKDLISARKLYDFAQKTGWKRSGLISFKNRFILELNGTDKLEFPLTNKGKTLVDKSFLKFIVDKSNNKLKKSWEKIKKLENCLE